jgi:mannose-6-phosphate isomerase-like protein (cupin superfamily)
VSLAVVDGAAGETLTAGPLRLRVLEDGGRTGHRLALVELTIPPGIAGPPQHLHREHDETFYVLSGTPTFTCGTDETHAQPGTLVTAAIGVPHTFANPGAEPAVLLCTFSPDLYVDYFRELARLAHGPTGLDPVAVGQLMRRYATEVVAPVSG